MTARVIQSPYCTHVLDVRSMNVFLHSAMVVQVRSTNTNEFDLFRQRIENFIASIDHPIYEDSADHACTTSRSYPTIITDFRSCTRYKHGESLRGTQPKYGCCRAAGGVLTPGDVRLCSRRFELDAPHHRGRVYAGKIQSAFTDDPGDG